MSSNDLEIKKYLGWYTAPLLSGIVLSLFAFAFWYGVSGLNEWRNTTGVRQINVTGEGKVSVKPDIAVLNISVVTDAKKIKDAQLDNTRRSSAVLGFLKERGIAEKDAKSVNYSILPQYQYFDHPPCLSYPCPVQTPKVVSYQVRHALEVKIRNLDEVDDLLDGVITNGATEIGSVNFTLDNEEGVKADARKKAIDDAKAKAEVLARDLGVRLGKIVGFSESGGPYPIYARAFEAKGGGGFGGDAAPTPQVEPGEQEIKSTVTITYEFR